MTLEEVTLMVSVPGPVYPMVKKEKDSLIVMSLLL